MSFDAQQRAFITNTIAPALEIRGGISRKLVENTMLYHATLDGVLKRKLLKITNRLATKQKRQKRPPTTSSSAVPSNATSAAASNAARASPTLAVASATASHKRNLDATCLKKLKAQFDANQAKSEVSTMAWSIRRMTFLEDGDGMITEESIRTFATQHTFRELENALCAIKRAHAEKDTQKQKRTFPYKTSNGRKALLAFFAHIGCVWKSGEHRGLVLTHPQPIQYRQSTLMYDRATEKVYMGSFNSGASRFDFIPRECVGTWRVPDSVKATWKADEVITMTDTLGTWETVRPSQLL